MNREILFRGKRLDNGEWITGQLLKYESGRARICESHSNIFCYESDTSVIQTVAHEVDPSTVGQYTDMTDKNGKKIFEGDLIKNFAGEVGRVSWYPEHFAFMIYRLHPPAVFHMETSDGPEIEIIGNIHDHPELLEPTAQ